MKKNIPSVEPLPLAIGISDIEQMTEASAMMVQAVRAHMFAPENRKKAPSFSATDLCIINKITRARFQYFLKKFPDLPRGTIKGNRLEFSPGEAIQWNRQITPDKFRNPKLNCAVTIAVVNFKGGVTKTTTVVTLAQGLALRGHKVLVVDMDPQGSATTLCGILPSIDVEEGKTALPIYEGTESSLDFAIRPTYWEGLDLVPAANEMHQAEFLVPSRQIKEANFEFWTLLDRALDSARDKYDVILIDSPPSLSYTTVNAIMAADGLIMPLPPSALDFASSAQFWELLLETMKAFQGRGNKAEKRFNFIDVLLSRVDNRVGVSSNVRDWIIRSFGAKLLPVEIPRTSIADTASAGFGTVYDTQQNDSIAKTLKRAKDAYEAMVEHVERQIQGVWIALADSSGQK